MEPKKALQIFVGVILIVAVLMAIMGFSGSQIDKVIQLIIPLGISFLLSTIIGSIVDSFGGGVLKGIFITVPIYGQIKVSMSLFAILVFTLKLWWF